MTQDAIGGFTLSKLPSSVADAVWQAGMPSGVRQMGTRRNELNYISHTEPIDQFFPFTAAVRAAKCTTARASPDPHTTQKQTAAPDEQDT